MESQPGRISKGGVVHLPAPAGWAVLAVAVLSLAVGAFYWLTAPNAYAVYINGERVAVVENEEIVETALQNVMNEKRSQLQQEMQYQDEVTFTKVRAGEKDFLSLAELEETFRQKLEVATKATVIRINGTDKFALPNLKMAEELLQQVKDHYRPAGEDVELESVEFQEQVELVQRDLSPEKLSSYQEALELLLTGAEKMEYHTVAAGESLWTIARANGLWPEDLQQANPELKNDVLQIGQSLKLVKAEPLVNVVTVWRETLQENIPYPVQVKQDSNLYSGQERVAQSGAKGLKEAEYRFTTSNGIQVEETVLGEKVLKEPKPRIVYRGTRVMVASRGGGGSGRVGWPIQGKITSGYGARWGRMHTGIDIDGETGDPVYAAADGTVIFAGSRGDYGRLLIIDHGDGLSTYYAHLSGYKTSVGDKVKRGDMVGLVGKTGNATGSSLHFEVRINGEPRNPMNYLR